MCRVIALTVMAVACSDRPLYLADGVAQRGADLSAPPRTPVDLATPGDLAPAIDLTTTVDLAAPVDLAVDPGAVLPCGRVGTAPTDPLARVQFGIVGNWRGTMTCPWQSASQVEVDIHADGTYQAKELVAPPDALSATPMYYDSDPETGQVDVQNLLGDGSATGWLTLAWLSYQEPMTEVRLNADFSTLHFTFYHFGQYGPISYQLSCVP